MATLTRLPGTAPPPEAWLPAENPPHPHTHVKVDHMPVKRWSSGVGAPLDFFTHRVTDQDTLPPNLSAQFPYPGAFRRARQLQSLGKVGLIQQYDENGPAGLEKFPEYKALPSLVGNYKIDEAGDYIVPPSQRYPMETGYGTAYRSLWYSTPFPQRLQDLKEYWKTRIVNHKSPEKQKEWENKIGSKFPTEEEMLPEKRDCLDEAGRLCWHRDCLQKQENDYKSNSQTPYIFQLPSYRDGYPSMVARAGWCGGLPVPPPEPTTCSLVDTYKIVEPELKAKAENEHHALAHMDAVYAKSGFPLHEWNYPTPGGVYMDRYRERHPVNLPNTPWPPVQHKFSHWEPPWLGKEKPDLSRLAKYSYRTDHYRPLWCSKPAYLPTPVQNAAWGTGLPRDTPGTI